MQIQCAKLALHVLDAAQRGDELDEIERRLARHLAIAHVDRRRFRRCRRRRGGLWRLWRVGQRSRCIAVLDPVLEAERRHRRHGADAVEPFAVRESVVVGFDRLGLAGEPQHGLVLVELARRGVDLVDDVHGVAVMRPEIDIDLITVRASGALDVAVGHRHGDFPRRSILADAAPHAASLVLDRDVEPVHLHMALLVVAGLCLGGRWLCCRRRRGQNLVVGKGCEL